MNLLRRTRDLIIETLVAVILVTAFVVYLFIVPKENRPNSAWVALTINTAIVFGFLISWFRYAWSSPRYWTMLGALLFCHSAIYIFALHRAGQLPLLFYVASNSAELVLFSRILWRFSGVQQSEEL
jgi:hypothetical protein